MVQKNRSHRAPLPDSLATTILRISLRVLQIVIALTVAGIYGRDLQSATRNSEPADSRWVWAEAVAGFSVILASLYLLPFVRSFRGFPADGVLFIFWMVLFGIFGKLFIHKDCEGFTACRRMKAGVWVDLVGMLLWFVSFVFGGIWWWKDRHGRSIYSGRGNVV